MRRLVLLAVLCVGTASLRAEQTPPAEPLSAVLNHVREYLAGYLARAQSMICDEAVTILTIGKDLMPTDARARTLRSEIRMSWEPAVDGSTSAPVVLRSLISVNGKPPKPKDDDKCFDPTAISPEALSGLFSPDNQDELLYTINGRKRIGQRSALVVEIHTREKMGRSEVVKVETCISVHTPGSAWWRVWVDATTYEVLRLEEFSVGPRDVTIPADKKLGTPEMAIVFERTAATTEYRQVKFSDPDEVIMLPASRQYLQIERGSQSRRINYTYRNYRRFMTGIRIVQ